MFDCASKWQPTAKCSCSYIFHKWLIIVRSSVKQQSQPNDTLNHPDDCFDLIDSSCACGLALMNSIEQLQRINHISFTPKSNYAIKLKSQQSNWATQVSIDTNQSHFSVSPEAPATQTMLTLKAHLSTCIIFHFDSVLFCSLLLHPSSVHSDFVFSETI